MADYASDSTVPSAPSARGHTQRTPSAAQGQKRNNHGRKSHQQMDGAVSDGAIIHPTRSPRSNKQHNHRQSVPTQQQNGNMGRGNAPRPRPVSYAGSQSATPAKEQAYAQSRFMASPAASALPMPKFSRSVPNAGGKASLSSRLAGERTPEQDQSSPEADVVAPAAAPTKSPMDMFFKADRVEKQRARSQESLSPDMAKRPATLPRNSWQASGRHIFLKELNGYDDMPSPRTIPQSDNRRPPIGERANSSPGVQARQLKNEAERQATTQSLKDLLFQNAVNSDSSTPQNKPHPQSGQQTPDSFFNSPSPFQSGPSTPQPSSEQQQQNHYSLHYGNRNLSPLFKAARSDIPPRPSSLRQEVASDTSSNADSGVAVNVLKSPNTFACNYLSETARTAGPAELPQLPFNNHPTSFGGLSIDSSTVPVNAQNGVLEQAANTSSSSPRAGSSRDIRTMEDDLRRMLKLNVMG